MNKLIVTIDREYGSGGHEIAKKLSKVLGFKFYDEEIIINAAKKTGLSEDYVRDMDEKAPDMDLSSLFNGALDFMPSSPLDRIQHEELRLIKEFANDNSVIVGRAADYVLDEFPHVSIFLFAPIEDRIDRKLKILSSENPAQTVDRDDMYKKVKQMDKQRRKYYEFYTDNKWGHRDNYDIVINTSKTGINGAVKIIETYIKECKGKNLVGDTK